MLSKRGFLPFNQDLCQLRCQPLAALLPQFLWHAVERLSDTAGDSRKRVAVAAEGYRRAESILKICAFQKRSDSLRYGLLTALYMVVVWTDLVAGAAEIITKLALTCALISALP